MLSVRCLSVTYVHCGQTVGRIKMKLGVQVGLGPGHYVLDGDPAPPPLISVAAKWLDGLRCQLPLGMEVGLSPGDFVLDGNPAP